MSTGTTNKKLSIDELKYIVMEGGGARGATYLGAIRELENQLRERVKKKSPKESVAPLFGRSAGIMDFLTTVEQDGGSEETKPIIEGVAGASAGAITTFALVLGLNSEEIKEVLAYDFVNFLSETDAGKYRMIDEKSQLAIGEDAKIDKAINHSTLRFKKETGLGLKNTKFNYYISKDKTPITGSIGKDAKRELLFNVIAKIIIDGVLSNLKQVMRIFSPKNENNWYNKLIKFLFGEEQQGEIATQAAITFAMKAAYSSVITGGLLALFNIKSKNIKITPNTVMAIFADRGMFSGFAVREFFFDLLIFAATKDTYFQKRLIAFFNDKENKKKYAQIPLEVFNLNLTREDFESKKNPKTVFKIGERSKYDFSVKFEKLLNHLQHLTFREFYNIMGGVEYAAAVSNFTTNSPLYFSDKYTPNARVLEAVASSMSIPPAIRPVYNASDVLLYPRTPSEDKDKPFQIIQEENIRPISTETNVWAKGISVTVNGEPKPFVKVVGDKVSFKKSDYELYEYAFKKGFQQYLSNRDKGTKVYVDTNNLLEINTFLDEMQKLLVGIRPNETRENVSEWPEQGIEVEVDNNVYIIERDLMRFFYNAQFKGLLLDGGYFNNIPFNFFREKGDPKKIDGVLPIKLDGHFPPDFLNSLDQSIAKFKVKVDDVMQQIEREELAETFSVAGQKLTLDTGEQINLQPIYNFISLQFNLQIAQKSKKEIRLEKKTIRKIVKEWYKYYGAHNNLKPWEIPRPILDIAFTGYSYGAKRGQIRDMSDHNNIIPLYDYGIGTYDFDMSKVKTLVDLAQHYAQVKVKEYFEKP